MEAAKHPVFQNFCPDLPVEILSLPKVEIPIVGVTGYCLRNHEKQLVFFLMEEGVSFPDHAHCEQTGTIISGEMTLEIDGRTELFQTGDVYRVPEGVRHRAHFSKPTFLIDLSDGPDRYKVCA
jgi:quercetin dioxygenase-like cupin family protein